MVSLHPDVGVTGVSLYRCYSCWKMSVSGESLPARHAQRGRRGAELPWSWGRSCGVLRGVGEISKQEVAPQFFEGVKPAWSPGEGS